MTQALIVRAATAADATALGEIAEGTGLFPAEMLPGMIEPYLRHGQGRWLSAVVDRAPVGFCYLEPERLTDNTWNMLALAVRDDQQGKGLGTKIVSFAEEELRNAGGRILIVETAGTDDFAPTRAFYAGRGYTAEARIPDFYDDGVDKVVFWKRL